MDNKQERLQIISRWMDQAEDNIKSYQVELKQYKRNKDKELIEFTQGELEYWQGIFSKYSKEYDDLMSPDYDEFQIALKRAKNVEGILREINLSYPGLNHLTGQYANSVGLRLAQYKEGERDLSQLKSTLERAEKYYETLAYQGLVNGKKFRRDYE